MQKHGVMTQLALYALAVYKEQADGNCLPNRGLADMLGLLNQRSANYHVIKLIESGELIRPQPKANSNLEIRGGYSKLAKKVPTAVPAELLDMWRGIAAKIRTGDEVDEEREAIRQYIESLEQVQSN